MCTCIVFPTTATICRDEKNTLLESIGFDFRLSEGTLNRTAWMEMYHRLLAYEEKYNNTLVPSKFEADPQLGSWVHVQRCTCEVEEQIDLLNYIGFDWNPKEGAWMEMYRRLLAYRKQYKNTLVDADPQLGHWVQTQRTLCALKHRIDLLNDIGFAWKVK